MTSATAEYLPLRTTAAPPDEAALAEAVRRAGAERCPVYPLGGRARLHYGAPPEAPGLGLATTAMDRVLDHAADDMTITVEAGITIARLAEVLAARGQRLPIDAPQPGWATIGGLVATNTFGPRRFGYRTIRDYLIGLRAVDGRGEAFAGGGRVVKNAAGYDMPRLLVGSLGTLGIVTEVSLMVRPVPEAAALLVAKLPGLDAADCLLAGLAHSAARPVSIDVLNAGWGSDAAPAGEGDDGNVRLLVGFEGSRTEVAWMVDRLRGEWQDSSAREVTLLDTAESAAMWQWIAELPAHLQANVLPGRAGALLRAVAEIDPGCALAVHAGDGVVKMRLSDEAAGDLPAVLAKLRPVVRQFDGSLVVLDAPPGSRLTRDDVWGPPRAVHPIMRAIKERFDPEGILNPGRWVL